MEPKIKQSPTIPIGENIRRIRLEKGMGQTELVRQIQLLGVPLTRESLVKIERGIQHISAVQLRAIRDVLQTTYDALLAENPEKMQIFRKKSLPFSFWYAMLFWYGRIRPSRSKSLLFLRERAISPKGGVT